MEMEEELLPQRKGVPFRFSSLQLKVIVILPMITGFLSVVGSSLIIYMILSKRKERLKRTYHRTVLFIAVVELLGIFWIFLSAIPVPKETGAFMAHGNRATCSAQGFFTHFSFLACYGNLFLLLYFACIIRYNMKEDSLRKIERIYLITAFVLVVSQAIVALAVLDVFVPVGLGPNRCYVSGFEVSYYRAKDFYSSSISPQQRAEWAKIFLFSCVLGPACFLQFALYSTLAVIVWTVRQNSTNLRFTSRRSARNMDEVIRQSSVYAIYFVTCYTTITCLLIVEVFVQSPANLNPGRLFALLTLSDTLVSLQGFFNFIVYCRPRFLRLQKLHRDKSWFFVLKATVIGDSAPHQGKRAAKNHSDSRKKRSRGKRRKNEEDAQRHGVDMEVINESKNENEKNDNDDEENSGEKFNPSSLYQDDDQRPPPSLPPPPFLQGMAFSEEERAVVEEQSQHEQRRRHSAPFTVPSPGQLMRLLVIPPEQKERQERRMSSITSVSPPSTSMLSSSLTTTTRASSSSLYGSLCSSSSMEACSLSTSMHDFPYPSAA